MFKRLRITALLSGLVLAGAMSAEAAPIQGGFSITGNFLPVIGATGASSSLGLATGLDFINFIGSAATPGVAGAVAVNSASGDFLSFLGASGTMQDFTFSGSGSALYPSPAMLAFQQFPGGGLTFDLLSIGVVFQSSTPAFLLLSGAGVFHLAGFDDTNGTFDFSGNGSSRTFSFSASQGATTAVPEPASLLVLAVGLLGSAGYMRRRMNRAGEIASTN